MTIVLIVLAVLLISVFACGLIWYLRVHNFVPTRNKKVQLQMLNANLEPTGFAYEPRGDYFYSTMNCWQRKTGYCKLYDESSPLFNMVMDCEPVTFSYGGKRWLIELWKGQYGITTGAEIGIYNTNKQDFTTEQFTGTYYETIRDDERLPMSFVLRKKGTVLIKRSALHWWLTGFKLGEYSSPETLTMDVRIVFPNREMCSAFLQGLQKIGYGQKEYAVRRTTVTIHYTKPHTPQPLAQEGVQKVVAQTANANNCNLYGFVTAKYSYTPDKLEYLKTAIPELYMLCFLSLYAKPFYEPYEWLRNILDEVPSAPIPVLPLQPSCPNPPRPPHSCCSTRPRPSCPPEHCCDNTKKRY